jgi:hypothetical protein
MNELQEAILDRLVVAEEFGSYFYPGPLQLAVATLQEAGLAHDADPGKALGYPPVLCSAVLGASQILRNADDCRAMSIALFTDVPPRPQGAPEISREKLLQLVLWSARHALNPRQSGRNTATEVLQLLETYLSKSRCDEARITQLSNALGRECLAVEATRRDFDPERVALQAVFFALHTLRRVWNGDDPTENGLLVMRDVARLAGLEGGIEGAVKYCRELARQIGM